MQREVSPYRSSVTPIRDIRHRPAVHLRAVEDGALLRTQASAQARGTVEMRNCLCIQVLYPTYGRPVPPFACSSRSQEPQFPTFRRRTADLADRHLDADCRRIMAGL